jgi:hypothetical protein
MRIAPDQVQQKRRKGLQNANDEQPDRRHKLIAFERRVLEVVFAKDALSGAETCRKSRSAVQHNPMAENSPHVTMDIAEMAARHFQAALPRSRGGRLSLLLVSASSCAVSGAGSTDVSTSKAFSTCDKSVPDAIVRHDSRSRHHRF